MKNNGLRNTDYRLPKKTVFLFSVFCFLSSVLPTGCAKREVKNINSQGRNIICFGDSIILGYGAERGEDYPSELAKMTEIPVINSGVDGDTSIGALRRIKSGVFRKRPSFSDSRIRRK